MSRERKAILLCRHVVRRARMILNPCYRSAQIRTRFVRPSHNFHWSAGRLSCCANLRIFPMKKLQVSFAVLLALSSYDWKRRDASCAHSSQLLLQAPTNVNIFGSYNLQPVTESLTGLE